MYIKLILVYYNYLFSTKVNSMHYVKQFHYKFNTIKYNL